MKINKKYILPLFIQMIGIILLFFNLDFLEAQKLPFYGIVGEILIFIGMIWSLILLKKR